MRPALLFPLLIATSSQAAETVRIAMGERPEHEVIVRGKGLQFGPDSEDGPFHPLDRDEVRVRHVGDALEVEGERVEGAVRFRTGDTSHVLRAGKIEVRGEVVAVPKGSRVVPGEGRPALSSATRGGGEGKAGSGALASMARCKATVSGIGSARSSLPSRRTKRSNSCSALARSPAW